MKPLLMCFLLFVLCMTFQGSARADSVVFLTTFDPNTPSSLLLFGAGLLALVAIARRLQKVGNRPE